MKKKKNKEILSDPDYGNISRKETEKNITLINKNSPRLQASYFIEEINDFKMLNKVIKKTEQMIRSSREYSMYIGYLHEIGLNNCSYLGNVKLDETVEVEIHHHPFTLYEIVNCVLIKDVLNKIPISTFILASQVIELHYNNLLGLVPLSKTVHELYHTNSFPIDKKRIFGNYELFFREYRPYMNEKIASKINNLVCYKDEDLNFLRTKLILK